MKKPRSTVPVGSRGRPPAQLPQATPGKLEIARALLQPSNFAANTIAAVVPTTEPLDIAALTFALQEQAALANAGDLKRAETMLMAQAHTLDAMFCALARRAMAQEFLNPYETHMRLALKAQSQCRATLETLAVLKNPPNPTFIRQANVAHGPQQVVNNATAVPEPSRARESQSEPSKLLEQQHGERLDTLTPTAAGRTDPAVATVGEVHGTEDHRG